MLSVGGVTWVFDGIALRKGTLRPWCVILNTSERKAKPITAVCNDNGSSRNDMAASYTAT